MIHKNAVIDETAKIGKNVEIEANVTIGKNVVIGDNVQIRAGAYLEYCEIGDGCKISPYAVIGTPPQDLGYNNENTKVIVGKNCQIKEFVTINRASGEGNATIIGDNCFIMAYAHIAHNCKLENEVIMANGATIAGHVEVGFGAFLGGMSVFHQNTRIGEMAIVSGASASRLDICPYGKSEGTPAILMGPNSIGLRRRGLTKEDRDALHAAMRILKSEHFNTTQAIEEIEKTIAPNEYVEKMIEFIRASKRGVGLRTNKKTFYASLGE